jgi:hypothetical protein
VRGLEAPSSARLEPMPNVAPTPIDRCRRADAMIAADSSRAGPYSAPGAAAPLVSVRDLLVTLHSGAGMQLLRGVSFDMARGEILGVVGESGARPLPSGAKFSIAAGVSTICAARRCAG